MVLLGTGEGLERTFGTGRKDKTLGYVTERTRYRALFVAHEVAIEALIESGEIEAKDVDRTAGGHGGATTQYRLQRD